MAGSGNQTAVKHVIELVSCAVKETVPDLEMVAQMDLDRVYETACFHRLAAAAGMALEAAGCSDPRFQKAIAAAQRRSLLLGRDRMAVLDRLEQEGIWYMPLKGVVLEPVYPRFGMREMADNDILIDPDRADDVRRIMTDLGFQVVSFKKRAHDIYYKEPVSNFEMHRMLFGYISDSDAVAYYADVKNRLLKDEGNAFGYHFSDEDFYLYLTAHEYKHYIGEGTGLRSLLDIYVYLQDRPLDWAYISREAEKMGLSGFEQSNRALALGLFDGKIPEDEKQEEILRRIISAGTYGSRADRVSREIAGKGRLRYLFSRLMLPREVMEYLFPILKKAPALYPFFLVYRLVWNSVKGRKKVREELKALLGRKPLRENTPLQGEKEEKKGERSV